MSTSLVGIDLAKNNNSVCSLNPKGKVISIKKLSRYKLAHFIQNHKPTLIAMEACGGAHYWARMAKEAGHRVKMMHPSYVKPFVKTNKNDSSDAHAIAEAALRDSIPCVPIKESWQQDILALHRIKERLTRNKTGLSNEVRGLLYEYGITLPKGTTSFKKKVYLLLDSDNESLSPILREQIALLIQEYKEIEAKLENIRGKIATISKQNETCKKLEKLPGIGPMTATAIVAAMGNGNVFKNGRHFAAWLGLVPKHFGTGGKIKIIGISKRGDRYIRKLLIQGAHAVLRWVEKKESPMHSWLKKLLQNKNKNKAAVALANKNARIIWKLVTGDEEFNISKAYAVAA